MGETEGIRAGILEQSWIGIDSGVSAEVTNPRVRSGTGELSPELMHFSDPFDYNK